MKTIAFKIAGTLLAMLTSLLCSSARADGITLGITDQTASVLVALEATSNDLLLLSLGSGASSSQRFLGSWTGAVTSNTWNLHFAGRVNGITTSINELGSLSRQNGLAMWMDSGLFGGIGLAGSGNVNIDTLNWQQTLGNSTTTAYQILICLFWGKDSKTCKDARESSDLLSKIGPMELNNSAISNFDGSDTFSSATLDSINVVPGYFGIAQAGSIDLTTGETSLSASVITPEPSSLLLLGSGLLGVAGFLRERLLARN